VHLSAQGEVIFAAMLAAEGPLSAGEYELRVVPKAFSQAVNPRATLLRFELRQVTDDAARAEVARRAFLQAQRLATGADILSIGNARPRTRKEIDDSVARGLSLTAPGRIR
jgi:hypothetical protein